ncbi:MAG: hypothetical protein ACKVP4_14900, partial [Hyphomicrobium sp.]
MTRDDDTRFEPRLGRIRSRGDGRVRRSPASFTQQVMRAVARAGGDPRRIGGDGARSGAPKTGRFNARGRGGKLV